MITSAIVISLLCLLALLIPVVSYYYVNRLVDSRIQRAYLKDLTPKEKKDLLQTEFKGRLTSIENSLMYGDKEWTEDK